MGLGRARKLDWIVLRNFPTTAEGDPDFSVFENGPPDYIITFQRAVEKLAKKTLPKLVKAQAELGALPWDSVPQCPPDPKKRGRFLFEPEAWQIASASAAAGECESLTHLGAVRQQSKKQQPAPTSAAFSGQSSSTELGATQRQAKRQRKSQSLQAEASLENSSVPQKRTLIDAMDRPSRSGAMDQPSSSDPAQAHLGAASSSGATDSPNLLGWQMSSPDGWRICPSEERFSPLLIEGRKFRVLKTNGDGACSMHAVWGMPAPSSEPEQIELVGHCVRHKVLSSIPDTWDDVCALRNSTVRPMLEVLVDRTWLELVARGPRDAESEKFENALPERLWRDAREYRQHRSQQDIQNSKSRTSFNSFAYDFFVEGNEADLVRPLACVLGYLKSEEANPLLLATTDPLCTNLENVDSDFEIMHVCGENKTKYQALFRPLRSSRSDYRVQFFHAPDSDEGLERKQTILAVLQNFLLNSALSASKHSLLSRGLDVLSKWFAVRAVRVPVPASLTRQEGWSALRKAMKDPSYWLSHEAVSCLFL